MRMPEFHRFFRPTLDALQDGEAHYWRDLLEPVAAKLSLDAEQREELVPSGNRTRLEDRVSWSLTYFRQAGLVVSPKRGHQQLTDRGKAFLKRAPAVVKPSHLEEFQEFKDFQSRSRALGKVEASDQSLLPLPTESERLTPEETIDNAYRQLNQALAQEVLDQVKRLSPAYFEGLIVKLMLRIGYGFSSDGAGEVLGKSGDDGVDGVINQDKLGLEKIYLQAKRWIDTPVGIKDIQAFVGALDGKSATKGVFITTSTFTRDATDFAKRISRARVSLVDGLQLAALMIEYDLGVSLVTRYEIKRVDSDFFVDG